MPAQQIVARDLAVGDLIRAAGPQAHRVERVLRDGGLVELQLRAAGLDGAELVRVSLPADGRVERLGTVSD